MYKFRGYKEVGGKARKKRTLALKFRKINLSNSLKKIFL
jgi:hypothetical protein